MSRSSLVRASALVVAGLASAGIAMLDRAQNEIQPAVLLLFVSAFALSCARPRDAWAHALQLGAGAAARPALRASGSSPPAL